MPATFYFPLLFIRPDSDWQEPLTTGRFQLLRRLWETSTFDLATLATRHKLHFPYQVMDVFLAHCNVEVAVQADDLDTAIERFHSLLFSLYIQGVTPTVAPYAATHGITDYSGINSRDSDALREKLPGGLRNGFVSSKGTVEAWPLQLSLACRILPDAVTVSPDQFAKAATQAEAWHQLEEHFPPLRVVSDAARSAPLLVSTDQSLLHIWSALEALFPKVSSEVSFRLALYVAQLQASTPRINTFHSVRESYTLRSRIAHGSRRDVTLNEWRQAWNLLTTSAAAILRRSALPTEDDLLNELLG